jgi:signal transduction histidine kinase
MFLAALGHDLRNPLHAIQLGAGSLARSSEVSPASAKQAHRIVRTTNMMARLIEQLLDFARARVGHPLPISRRRTDLKDLWREVIDEIELSEPGRRVILRALGDTSGEWDPDRMLRVFQNLGWNAAQYGDPLAPIEILLQGTPESVVVEVHNEGEPIPPAQLSRLFDPFRRAYHKGHGLGLGLFIAREIVRLHSGQIEASSSGSAGTTFRILLPRAAPDQDAADVDHRGPS